LFNRKILFHFDEVISLVQPVDSVPQASGKRIVNKKRQISKKIKYMLLKFAPVEVAYGYEEFEAF
jgi:hypothetical protein